MSYIAVCISIPLAVRRCPLILVWSSHFFGSASAGANGLANVCISSMVEYIVEAILALEWLANITAIISGSNTVTTLLDGLYLSGRALF